MLKGIRWRGGNVAREYWWKGSENRNSERGMVPGFMQSLPHECCVHGEMEKKAYTEITEDAEFAEKS